MRRMVWVALGAAGGIVAYRKVQQALVDARERGVVLSVQQVGLSAAQALTTARVVASGAVAAAETKARSHSSASASGSAAAQVLHQPARSDSPRGEQ
jgi:hypothetical protein